MVPPLSVEVEAVAVGLDDASRALAGSCANVVCERHSAVATLATYRKMCREEDVRSIALVELLEMMRSVVW